MTVNDTEPNQNMKEYYTENELFERFMFRYFERCQLSKSVRQHEIYLALAEYCEKKNQPLASENQLGRYLCRLPGLLNKRTSGNARVWYGLGRREQVFTGHIEPTPEFLSWQPEQKESPYDENRDKVTVTGDWRPRGRPVAGDEIPYPVRTVGEGKIKGVRWSRLYRLYRRVHPIAKFKETCLDTTFSTVCTPREEIWHAFDQFCQKLNIPTCSAIQLRKTLKLNKRENLDGTEDWVGVTLKASGGLK